MKKKVLLSIALLTCARLSWGIISFIRADQKKLLAARTFLINGSYEQCNEQLSSLNSKKLDLPLALYQGYLFLMQEEFVEAKRLFEESKKEQQHLPLLQIEATLASALCSYCQGAFDEVLTSLLDGSEQSQKNPWFKLMRGFLAFKEGAYKSVLSLWNDLDYYSIEEETLASTWGIYCIKAFLKQEDFELQLARALIEENDFILARELLERTKQNATLSYTNSLISMYLGYSYLKEAEQRTIDTLTSPLSFIESIEQKIESSIDKQLSYYKLAAFYFERTSISSLEKAHKELIISKLSQKAEEFIQQNVFAAEALIYLITPLQKWQCTEELNHLAELIATKLTLLSAPHEQAITSIIKSHFENSLFHHMVTEKLTEIIIEEISKGRIDLFSKEIEIRNSLVANSFYFQQKCINHVFSHLDYAILQDDERLEQLHIYLKLLDNLGEIHNKLPHLTVKLLEQAKVLWQEDGQEIKATKLMQLALNLSPDKGGTKENIEHYLSTLFDQAEASNLIERLNYIYDALIAFKINTKSSIDPSILANHLADAHYRFQTREFLYSKVLSSWVLKLDPHNQEALRLLGLNYYHLGNYQEAITVLQKLFFLDEYTHKALVISEVLSSHDQDHLIEMGIATP